ncbi:GNAT family protein [Pullulanibacillus sp. KACC 23026]|uniref:GNAT family N-acetyltransferase n=1 Tax=Pullulanibacillus sp. KACC 23026 TaxID=3028315 RepID=UPI0023B1BE64|nr:GNAT family protein [Pullulanibacillus sp. KACC 23026]WEG13010.1 GNAT family protein [Pullulanibacillus sp. KACC 23026]
MSAPDLIIPTIETEHYILKPLEHKHAEALFLFLSDKKTMQFITPHPVKTLAELEDQINEQLAAFENKKEIPWVIQDKATHSIVGTIRFHKLRSWHRSCEIGVVLSPHFQQKGVMTEIMPFLLDYGFKRLRLNRIVGDIFAGNQGSRRLLERFGFQKEGVMRQTDFDGERFHDTVVYSMLKEEYELRMASGTIDSRK